MSGGGGGGTGGKSAEDIYYQNRQVLENHLRTAPEALDEEDRKAFLDELKNTEQLGRGSDPWNLDYNQVTQEFLKRIQEAQSPEYSAKKKERQRVVEQEKLRQDTPGIKAQTTLGSGSIQNKSILGGGASVPGSVLGGGR